MGMGAGETQAEGGATDNNTDQSVFMLKGSLNGQDLVLQKQQSSSPPPLTVVCADCVAAPAADNSLPAR